MLYPLRIDLYSLVSFPALLSALSPLSPLGSSVLPALIIFSSARQGIGPLGVLRRNLKSTPCPGEPAAIAAYCPFLKDGRQEVAKEVIHLSVQSCRQIEMSPEFGSFLGYFQSCNCSVVMF